MRTSSFCAASFVVVAASGCAIEPKVQFLFEDAGEPPKTATRDWNGEEITIDNAGNDDGVNPRVTAGGVEVRVSSTATKISVEAVFAAWADDDLASNAWASMDDAKKTLRIDESPTRFDVVCGHGNTHGTSRGRGAGCKILRVTIPAGTAAQPLALTIITGSASVRVDLATPGDAAPHVRRLLVESTGRGDVALRVRPVKDASLAITGEGPVSVALPGDFSARSVLLTADEASTAEVGPRSITTEFAGMKSGSAYPPTGASADAAAVLNVRSKTGTIAVTRF